MRVDRNLKNIGYPAQMGILLGFIGAGLIIGGVVSVLLWMMMTNKPILSMPDEMLKPQYYYAVMMIQAVSTFFMFFLPVYFLALLSYRKPMRFIGFNTNFNYRQVLVVLAILALTFPLSGALAELNNIIPIPKQWALKFKAMEDARALQEAALIKIDSFPKYLISLVVIGLLPGIFEEVCFRGGIQNIFTRWFAGPWVAIVFTSVIFSIIHISYYGFLVRFGLGVILGILFYYGKNIWLPILFHFLYNGLQVTALYVMKPFGKDAPKDIEQNFPIWAGVIALVLIVYLFMKFRDYSEQVEQVEDDFPDDDFHNWVTAQS